MKLKKLVLSSFMIAGFVMLCNLRGGATAYAVGLEERMDYLETRISELFTTTDGIKDTVKEQKTFLDTLRDRVTVGAGLRTSFTALEDGAPDGRTYSKDFSLDNMRLYVTGKVTEKILFRFNTEVFGSDTGTPTNFKDARVLDAYASIKFNDMFNIWVGHQLAPMDRSGLDGPFYLNVYDFPFVQAYPMHFSGQRDNGVTLFGDIAGGKLRYAVGAFEGRQGGPNQEDELLYAGRLTINFWEPDFALDYWTTSAYYGEKDVLSLGLVFWHQQHGAGSSTVAADFDAWNVDLLFEKNIKGFGVVNLEGAYYNYDLNGVTDSDPGAFFNLTDGNSYFALASFMFPQEIGWGRFQPFTRFQSFNRHKGDGTVQEGTHNRLEIGTNYIMKGQNGKLAIFWAHDADGEGSSRTTSNSRDFVKFALQLQF